MSEQCDESDERDIVVSYRPGMHNVRARRPNRMDARADADALRRAADVIDGWADQDSHVAGDRRAELKVLRDAILARVPGPPVSLLDVLAGVSQEDHRPVERNHIINAIWDLVEDGVLRYFANATLCRAANTSIQRAYEAKVQDFAVETWVVSEAYRWANTRDHTWLGDLADLGVDRGRWIAKQELVAVLEAARINAPARVAPPAAAV